MKTALKQWYLEGGTYNTYVQNLIDEANSNTWDLPSSDYLGFLSTFFDTLGSEATKITCLQLFIDDSVSSDWLTMNMIDPSHKFSLVNSPTFTPSVLSTSLGQLAGNGSTSYLDWLLNSAELFSTVNDCQFGGYVRSNNFGYGVRQTVPLDYSFLAAWNGFYYDHQIHSGTQTAGGVEVDRGTIADKLIVCRGNGTTMLKRIGGANAFDGTPSVVPQNLSTVDWMTCGRSGNAGAKTTTPVSMVYTSSYDFDYTKMESAFGQLVTDILS